MLRSLASRWRPSLRAAAAAGGLGFAAYGGSRLSSSSSCDAGAKPAAAPSEPPSKPSQSLWESVTAPLQSALDSFKEVAHENLVAPFTEPSADKLLPDLPSRLKGKELPTIVIALDDVLIHSTWDRQYGWRYMKRPGVDEFLRALAPYYEIVVWTEQFSMMEPVIVSMDRQHAVRHRLYKDGMVYRNGRHVKDLSHVNRDLAKTVVIDCNAANATQQPENYVLVKPFTGEPTADEVLTPVLGKAAKPDDELTRYIPFLLNLARLSHLKGVDTREEIRRFQGADIPSKFAEEYRALQGGRRVPAHATKQSKAQESSAPVGTVWERLRASRSSA